MQKRGKTAAGTQRWFCFFCRKSGIKQRPDHWQRKSERLFQKWLTGNATLADLAERYRVSKRTIQNWLIGHWPSILMMRSKVPARIMIFDATRLDETHSLQIGMNAATNKPNFWSPANRESYTNWQSSFAMMPQEPEYVVCDGHSGLIKAVRERWPAVLIQRCMAHVVREIRKWLTRNPKLPAGKELKFLAAQLSQIQTRRQKRRWIRKFFKWQRKYAKFLKEKTTTEDGHWRYKHRSVRRAGTHLLRAIPDLFRYISDHSVPRTSNQLEGGLNGPLKNLIGKHRGLVPEHELVLMSLYLKKRAQKPPRCFY